MFDFW
jgi:hypothetical protein